MRLADADLLAVPVCHFADTVRTYIDELKKLDAVARQTEELNREIDEACLRRPPIRERIRASIENPVPRI